MTSLSNLAPVTADSTRGKTLEADKESLESSINISILVYSSSLAIPGTTSLTGRPLGPENRGVSVLCPIQSVSGCRRAETMFLFQIPP